MQGVSMKSGAHRLMRRLAAGVVAVALGVIGAAAQVSHPRKLALGEAPAIVAGGQFEAGPNPYQELLSDHDHQEVGRLSYYLFRRDLHRAEDWVARHDDALGDLGGGLLLMVRADGGDAPAAGEWQMVGAKIRARRHAALVDGDAWGWMVRSYGYLWEGWRDATTGHPLRAKWARYQARRGFVRVKRLAPELAEADLGIALLIARAEPGLAQRFLDHAATHSVYVAPLADLVRVAWASRAGRHDEVVAIGARYHLTVVHSPFLLDHVGDAYLALNRPREAGQWYQRLAFEVRATGAAKLKVAQAQAAQARAERSAFWQERMRRAAKTSYEDYLASGDTDPARRALGYVELGNLEAAEGRPEVARRYFLLALEKRPGDPAATAALATLEAK